MARLGRCFLPSQPQHVIQRGNNRQALFFCDDDYRFYLECLRGAALRLGCPVHAYVLMTNHVHLLVSPKDADSLSRTLQSVGRRFVRQINWRRERTGTLWEGRFRATAIESDRYFLTCSRYIELNPVRAGMVHHPREYRWSSFAANVDGRVDPLVTPHELYGSLGATPEARRTAYAALFETEIDAAELLRIREATQKGWALGGEVFQSELSRATGRRAAPLAKGGARAGSGRKSHKS